MGFRNSNLELGLLPSSSSDPSHSSTTISSFSLGSNGESPIKQEQEKEQMTIFYNGNICVCDVTELQAKSIIWYASKKMEEVLRRSPMPAGTNPISPLVQSRQLCTPTGLSMKKSLRQFLEKRRDRVQATAPYHR